MAKNQVSIKINAQDNATTSIQKVTARLNETTSAIKKAQDPLKKLQNSFVNFSLAVPGIKLVGSAMTGLKKNVSECVTAFAEIEKSTKQLQFAQNVNVQLKAVGADLTRFAADMSKNFRNVFSQGEIQAAITELSFDHTYDEIEKITRVAGDLASATGMSLSQAVDTLSNTLNGKLSPELKRIAPELGSLDSEAVKSGKAIDILGDKLSGLAAEMSGTTGASITAFNNTVDDLKETLGGVFSTSITPMRNYFTELLSNLNSAISEYARLKTAKDAVENGTADSRQSADVRTRAVASLIEGSQKDTSWLTESIANAIIGAYENGQSGSQLTRYNNFFDASGNRVADEKIIKAFNDYKLYMDAYRNGGEGELSGVIVDSIKTIEKSTETLKAAIEKETTERTQAQEELADAVESVNAIFGSTDIAGMNLRNATNNGFIINSLGLPALGGGYSSDMDATMPENTYSAMAGGTTSIFGVDSEIFEGILKLTESFSLLNEIMNPVTTIFTGIVETLDPIVSSLLQPLNNMLKILGQFIGQIIIPVLQMLAPVIDVITKAFTWLYNKVLLPVGNDIISLFNVVFNAMAAVANGFIWLYNAIVPKSKEKNYVSYRSLDTGHMSELSDSAVANYGSTGTSSTGGGASYTAARDITVNIYYNHSFVNGDAREIAVNLRDEIRLAEALGY